MASLLPFDTPAAEAAPAVDKTAAPAPPALRKSLLETILWDADWSRCSEDFIIVLLLADKLAAD